MRKLAKSVRIFFVQKNQLWIKIVKAKKDLYLVFFGLNFTWDQKTKIIIEQSVASSFYII